MDHEQFYLSWDVDMLVDFIQSNLAYLKRSWNLNGRPTMTLEVTRYLLGEQGHKTSMLKLLQKLNSGYSMGARYIFSLIHFGREKFSFFYSSE